ncbi:unnamed protein product [Linum tenue]|uniref:D-alanine--D-alanine ligase N-terminal domain-containing protein n=1 Tax=Linum tenue TaxID=586396 RepID=A0AAV0PZW5_9ROSI|nr:unnamed protein product [Linum tenue]
MLNLILSLLSRYTQTHQPILNLSLKEHLAASVDIVFPVIHAQFGEDGGIQELLEKYNIHFVGTGSSQCRRAFDKVKPVRAGSSIGVTVAYGVADALKKAKDIKLEVELHSNDDDAIFNYRRKYLPTRKISGIEQTSFLFQQASKVGFSHSNILRSIVHHACSSYSLVLRHTVEEVLDACTEATDPSRASLTSQLRKQVMGDLMEGLEKHRWFNGFDITDEKPVKFSLHDWIKHAKEVQATVFLTGPGILASKICMDKVATSLAVSHAHGPIEMPNPPPEKLIFEPFIKMDEIIVSSKSADGLLWEGESRWVEIKVGVVGKRGCMQSLCLSITVKEGGDILSLEEKFQGGTCINLTPPPPSIVRNVSC